MGPLPGLEIGVETTGVEVARLAVVGVDRATVGLVLTSSDRVGTGVRVVPLPVVAVALAQAAKVNTSRIQLPAKIRFKNLPIIFLTILKKDVNCFHCPPL